MNALLAPPEFLLAEQYASAVTTLGVALCWAPVLPVSPLLAALGAPRPRCAALPRCLPLRGCFGSGWAVGGMGGRQAAPLRQGRGLDTSALPRLSLVLTDPIQSSCFSRLQAFSWPTGPTRLWPCGEVWGLAASRRSAGPLGRLQAASRAGAVVRTGSHRTLLRLASPMPRLGHTRPPARPPAAGAPRTPATCTAAW